MAMLDFFSKQGAQGRRWLAGAAVGTAMTLVLTVSGLLTAPAAFAAASPGLITVPGSVITRIDLSNKFALQITSPSALGGTLVAESSWTNDPERAWNSGLLMRIGGKIYSSASLAATSKASGGTGHFSDPYWIQNSVSNVNGTAVGFTLRANYADGDAFVRVDYTFSNNSISTTEVDFAYELACHFGGIGAQNTYPSATGKFPACAARANAPRPDARAYVLGYDVGHTAGSGTNGEVGEALLLSGSQFGPLANGCQSQQTCNNTTTADAAIAMSSSPAKLAPHASLTKSFYILVAPELRQSRMQADLSVSTGSVMKDEEFDYRLTMKNDGPDGARRSLVDFMLPAGVQYVSHTSSAGEYNAATGRWQIDSEQAVGQSLTLTIRAKATSLGTFSAAVSRIVSSSIDLEPCTGGAMCSPVATVTVLDMEATFRALTSAGKPADGVSAHKAEVLVTNTQGKGLPGQTVRFRADNPLAILSPISAVTNSEGLAVVDIAMRTPGVVNVTALVGPSEVIAAGSPLSFLFVAGPPVAASSTLTVSPGDRIADGEDQHTITVSLADSSGNPVSEAGDPFPAVIEVAGATVGAAVETGTPGTYQLPVRSETSGLKQVTASIGGSPIMGSPAQLSFVPGPVSPATSSIVVTAGDRIADGVDTHEATILLRDAHGNPISGAATAFPVTLEASQVRFGAVVEAEPGTYTVTASSIVAGERPLTARTATGEIAGSPATLSFVAGAPAHGASSLTVTEGVRVANGREAHEVTVEVRDGQGNPVTGALIAIEIYVTGAKVSALSETETPGRYSASVTSTVAGVKTVTALVGGVTVPDSPAQLVFVPGPADSATSHIAVTDGTRIANGSDTHTATIVVRDANGNPLSGLAGSFPFDVSVSEGDIGAPSEIGDSGSYELSLASTVAGEKTITATLAGVPIDGSPVLASFVAGATDPSASTLSVTDGERVADGKESHTATVALRDKHDNPVLGAEAAFPVVVEADGAFLTVPRATDVPGEYQVDIAASTPGEKIVTAAVPFETRKSAGSVEITGSPSAVTFIPRAPANATVTVPDVYCYADGVESHTATVVVTDRDGIPVPDARVEFASTATLSATTAVTDADGRAFVAATAVTPGEYGLTVVVGDVIVDGSPAVLAFGALPQATVAKPTIDRGQEQIVRGYNFRPGETVTADIGGTLVEGRGVGDDGTVEFATLIASDLAPGSYEATLAGSAGRSASDTFAVNQPGGLAATGGAALGTVLALVGGLVLLVGTVAIGLRNRPRGGSL